MGKCLNGSPRCGLSISLTEGIKHFSLIARKFVEYLSKMLYLLNIDIYNVSA